MATVTWNYLRFLYEIDIIQNHELASFSSTNFLRRPAIKGRLQSVLSFFRPSVRMAFLFLQASNTEMGVRTHVRTPVIPRAKLCLAFGDCPCITSTGQPTSLSFSLTLAKGDENE